jgi:hypothetical protein
MGITREARYEKWHREIRQEIFSKIKEDNFTEGG